MAQWWNGRRGGFKSHCREACRFESDLGYQVMTNEEKIAAKKAEIAHYEGVLERYGSGRWLDQGRRHLQELKDELVALCPRNIDGDVSHS